MSRDTDADQLSDDELQVVVDVMRALVDRDEDAVRGMGGYERGGDPFTWVDYCLRDGDRLVMPDTDPRTWTIVVIRSEDDDDWVGLVVVLWTEQEGEWDMSVELDIARGRPKLLSIK